MYTHRDRVLILSGDNNITKSRDYNIYFYYFNNFTYYNIFYYFLSGYNVKRLETKLIYLKGYGPVWANFTLGSNSVKGKARPNILYEEI